MSSTINASTASGGGIITSADASGILALQTAGVTGLTIDASQNVTFAKAINKAALPTGSVLQVVSVAIQTNFSTTTNGFVSTPITASITPSSATNKILIQISPVVFITGSTVDAGVGFGIVRGATQIYSTSYIAFYAGSGTATNAGSIPYIQYLDSPATTSSTTYTLQVTRYTNNGGTTVLINRNYVSNDTSVITLIEVAA